MPPSSQILIFGASTRAAAFSALRAGLSPWCADLFADADLANCCAVTQLPADRYPMGFLRLVQSEMSGPWMYTGGLENHPRLIRRMAGLRPLWGNGDNALVFSRHPGYWGRLLEENDIPHPTAWPWDRGRPLPVRWLVKPLRGAGGRGISFWMGGPQPPRSRVYLQEFVQGVSCAAVYCGSSTGSALLGVTQQLVGEDWLHAGRFQYGGSIGPIALNPSLRERFERQGKVLVSGLKLRGLFGVDCVLRDGVPYPVEINPRYTASIEVLEHATGLPALSWHRGTFEGGEQPSLARRANRDGPIIGKAILFARAPLTFPAEGSWMETLRQPVDIWEIPAFADIPHPGTPIEAGKPILTFFARADSVEECRAELQRIAGELDDFLFGG